MTQEQEVQAAWKAIQAAHRFHCGEVVRKGRSRTARASEARRHYGRNVRLIG